MRKGQKQSPEARAKISAGMRGKQKSLATREKMAFKRAQYWARKRREAKLMALAEAPLLDEGPMQSLSEDFND